MSAAALTDSITPHSSPCASARPTSGYWTNTMSPSCSWAWAVMPTVAVPSASVRTHSWLRVYLRSAGVLMAISCRGFASRIEQEQPVAGWLQICRVELQAHIDLGHRRHRAACIHRTRKIVGRQENAPRDGVLLQIGERELERGPGDADRAAIAQGRGEHDDVRACRIGLKLGGFDREQLRALWPRHRAAGGGAQPLEQRPRCRPGGGEAVARHVRELNHEQERQ